MAVESLLAGRGLGVASSNEGRGLLAEGRALAEAWAVLLGSVLRADRTQPGALGFPGANIQGL